VAGRHCLHVRLCESCHVRSYPFSRAGLQGASSNEPHQRVCCSAVAVQHDRPCATNPGVRLTGGNAMPVADNQMCVRVLHDLVRCLFANRKQVHLLQEQVPTNVVPSFEWRCWRVEFFTPCCSSAPLHQPLKWTALDSRCCWYGFLPDVFLRCARKGASCTW